jgi:serine/threonine-protein kinase
VHPNIVAIHDVDEVSEGERAGTAYLAMELVEGRSLRACVGDESVPVPTRLRWLTDAARGIAAAHDRGLVHRDVKPENIVVSADGVAKVLDFGIAKRVAPRVSPAAATTREGALAIVMPIGAPPGDRDDAATASTEGEGAFAGTPLYMSPEQLRTGDVGPASDQFSWAVVAYELLCGESPWQTQASVVHVAAAILEKEPTPPHVVNPALPAWLDAILLRALSKSEDARFPSMHEVIARLERGGSPSPALPRPLWSPVVRRRLATIFAVAMVAGIGVGLRIAERPPSVVAPAVSPPAAPATTITEAPAPSSKSPEAMAAYRAGMRAFHEGSMPATRAAFQRAVDLDPEYGAAHFRLGDVAMGQGDMTTARTELAAAMRLRASLSDDVREMLEADEPMALRSPPDFDEALRRANALVAREPRNAELRVFLGYVDAAMHDQQGALAEGRAALALDPQFGFGYLLEGAALAELGRSAEALAAFDRCLEHVPGAFVCLSAQAEELGEAGRCEEMGADIERIIAAAPELAAGYSQRVDALLAKGAPRDTIEAAAAQSTGLRSGSARESWVLWSRENIAIAFGDFASVIAGEGDAERVLERTMDLEPRAKHALRLAEAFVESGRPRDAARVAKSYLQRRDLWIANGVVAGAVTDATPRLAAIARDAGTLSDDDANRATDSFVRRWAEIDRGGDAAARTWLAAATGATTRAQAEALLSRLPPGASKARVGAKERADLGEVYRLAGRLDDALPLLEAGARSCMTAYEPLWHVRAAFHLAQARDAKGDAAGACEAYGAVLARWGAASPRSTTAEQARARLRALKCR